MRRIVSAVVALSVAVVGLQALAPSAAQATPRCTFTPVLPKRVSVGQSVVGLRVPLRVDGGQACRANPDVSTQLVHGTDSYFLWWLDSKPDVESVYAGSIRPGRYRTTASDCDAYDANVNSLSCGVRSATTVIKFAGHPRLAATRRKSVVTLTVRTKHFAPYRGSVFTKARVAIQRYRNGRWHTVHTARAAGRKGYTWRCHHRKRARYRAVSFATSSTFGGRSSAIRK